MKHNGIYNGSLSMTHGQWER